MLTSARISVFMVAIVTVSWLDYMNVVADVERLPPINKSPRDYREYRGIKLANGLQALLISDSKVEKSAAALVVVAGSMNDVKEQPGIANLVRYLLLAVCQKYRKKNDLKEYLKERGGKLGSELTTTEAEHKHFFSFEVKQEFFGPTLNRFAQHFIEPLFEGVNDAALKEALGKLSRKHDRLMSADTMRITQVLKSISEKDHEYNNLSYGTIEMLNKYAGVGREPLDEKLTNFVHKWYSADLMRLVVIGAERLDALEATVTTSLFAAIENTGVKKLVFPHEQHPWKSDQLKHKICIAPTKDESLREIRLTFPTPDVLSQYKISPERYVIQFIKNGGPGTLVYILTRRNLCKSKSVGAKYETYAGSGFFTIMMEPTEKGLKEVDSIVDFTFQYLHLLKSEGVRKWFYDEENLLDSFNFIPWTQRPMEMIQNLASAMHDYPVEDIISLKYVRGPWKARPVHKFLSYLRPDNVNIAVIDKSCKAATNFAIEPWYETKYQIERISDEIIKKWELSARCFPLLNIPPRNEFIPDNIGFDRTDVDPNRPYHPYVIHTSSTSRIWYKHDDDVPLIQVSLEILSSSLHLNLVNGIYMEIFIKMLSISLETDYEYSASRTANLWAMMVFRFGYQIKLVCTTHKLVLLEKILSRLLYFDGGVFSEEDFERAKNLAFSELEVLQQGHAVDSETISSFYMSFLLNTSGWDVYTNMSPLKKVFQYRTMRKYWKKFFSRIHIQGLIYGNCGPEKARNIANIIEGYFKRTSRGMLPQEMLNLVERPIELESGKNYVYHIFNDSSKHFYHGFFPFGFQERTSLAGIRFRLISHLFLRIAEETCTKILPPRDTGTSKCRLDSFKTVDGFAIVINSSQMHPLQLDMRTEKFLEIMRDKLRNLTEAEFIKHKLSIRLLTISQAEDRAERFQFYWEEIKDRTYIFNRNGMNLEEIMNIKKEEVIAFYEKFLSKRSPERRKLSIYVHSKTLIQNTSGNISAESTIDSEEIIQSIEIKDYMEHKIFSTTLPIQIPMMNIVREL